nr:hypothetical protein [Bacteroides pyogenes]
MMPKGPKGDAGLSAYDIWKQKVADGTIDWPKNEVEVTDFFKYLKGKDGVDGIDGKSAYEVWKEQIAKGDVDDPHNPGKKWDPKKNSVADFWKFLTGASGENGQTPRIGDNGNWWIGDVDTKIPARGPEGKPGEPGKDAEPPVVTIGDNGNWFINGKDTGKPSKGADGKMPTVTIGDNGNWFVNGKDTGKKAVGEDGKAPEVVIGDNGNWFINGKDTGKPAYGKEGKPGADGKNGKSAYELWKEEIAKGKTPDPHNPGAMWDPKKDTVADFWQFLRGADGKDGKDAYEVWKEKVLDGTIDWPKDKVEVTDFFKYLKGKDGVDGIDGKSAYEVWKEQIAKGDVDDPHNPGKKWDPKKNTVSDFWKFLTGASGENGQTPRIGDNGNWWIGDVDTKIPARGPEGKPGKDAEPPVVTIGDNGNWFINGKDTGKPSKGADGKMPTVTIGDNGNWFVNGKDTGKKAVGEDGKAPEVVIGDNGNWFINGKDTGKPAYGKEGKPGADGKDGKSAYELWKEEIAKGKTPDPHNPGAMWDPKKDTVADFWQFLRGKDGEDGIGGDTSAENEPITIIVGKFNVIPQYSNSELQEYVIPSDGSVLFQVYDKEGKAAPAGSVVKGLPGLPADLTFNTDAKGQFKVPMDKLPNLKKLKERKGVTTSVTIGGVTEASAENTLVPNRINVKAELIKVAPHYYNPDKGYEPVVVITYRVQCQVNGQWKAYPFEIAEPGFRVATVKNADQPVAAANVEMNETVDKWNRYHEKEKKQVSVIRPYILTEREKKYIATPEGAKDELKEFQWDGKKKYVTLVFGDGSGASNDYGHVVYPEEKVYSPEINPICDLKNVKIEVKHGESTLWGEFDVNQLGEFYPVEAFVKDKAKRIWNPVGEKKPASELPKDFNFMIMMSMSHSGSGGLTSSYSNYPIFTKNSRFTLVSAYPKNYVELQGGSEYAKYYRGRKAYNFVQDAYWNYILEDYNTKEGLMVVPQGYIPTDWMK